jgi:hypothetical protein
LVAFVSLFSGLYGGNKERVAVFLPWVVSLVPVSLLSLFSSFENQFKKKKKQTGPTVHKLIFTWKMLECNKLPTFDP